EYCIKQESFMLDHVRTNLTPEGKAREVQIFRAKGNIVAVVGNDENDLPALKAGDVSFLLRGGTITKLQAKVNPLDFEIPKLRSFLAVRSIAALAENVLNVNYIIAFLSWILLVPPALLSAFGLLPITFHPLIAIAGVIIFSLLIFANSLRTN
ncbi:MAG: cation-translocating P-type ATPase, partial [Selenomonadaceae bacterium]|nr:cation-translocating P-type ATPase [Selenomonadaceae bacterium]